MGVFLGERSRPDFYNQELYRDGHGWFPVPLAHTAELLIDRLQRVPDLDVTQQPIHRVFRVFEGTRNSFLPLVIVERYFATPKGWQPSPTSGVQVIARLRGGRPFAIEKQYGRGRVVAFMTTAGPTWNNWARENPSFPVAMLELQGYLASQLSTEVPHLVGMPLDVVLDPAQYEEQVEFTTPDKTAGPMRTEAAMLTSGKLLASFPATGRAGMYQARLLRKDGKEEIRQWAYNVEAEEGDLRVISGPELASRLEGIQYEYHPAALFQYDSQEQEGYNLSSFLLYLLVFLLIVEQILAWSASYHPATRMRHETVGGGR